MSTRKERHLRKSLSKLETRVNSIRFSKESLYDTASVLYEDLDTPTSLGLFICLKYGDVKSVVTHEIDVSQFDDLDVFRRSYQAVSFLRKIQFSVDGLDPVAQARLSFRESEALCATTNLRFRRACSGDTSVFSSLEHTILHDMTRDIAAILGGFNPSTWELSCRFGPGAAFGSPGPSPYDKLGASPCVTQEFATYGLALVNASASWVDAISNSPPGFELSEKAISKPIQACEVRVAQGGSFSQVPKSCKTHRNIEVQPNLNAYAQLGLGTMIRRRLQQSGLDLRRQANLNKSAARRGSKYGNLSTIDLSSASDTIAYGLVLNLLPQRWFHAMDICRTKCITGFESEPLTLERFSSMGNGYTFELETLIFWSLVRACRRYLGDNNEYHVFGDDIICSTSVAKLVMKVIPALGFQVNAQKSYISGAFRESCGGDFFHGTNVRPYFYKKGVDNSDLQAIISLANGLRRASWRSNNHYGCCSRFRRAWSNCLRRVPRDIRLLLTGPWSDQDQWLITSGEWHDNPGIFKCPHLWVLKVPSLLPKTVNREVASYSSARAAMLYELEKAALTWESDELILNLSRAPRKSTFFAVPNSYRLRQHLDVTTAEVNPGMHIWL